MDRAFGCYTKDQIADYYERVKREGLTEHGFPRLASNLGVLICHGRHKELLPLFIDLMDLCCEQMPNTRGKRFLGERGGNLPACGRKSGNS